MLETIHIVGEDESMEGRVYRSQAGASVDLVDRKGCRVVAKLMEVKHPVTLIQLTSGRALQEVEHVYIDRSFRSIT